MSARSASDVRSTAFSGAGWLVLLVIVTLAPLGIILLSAREDISVWRALARGSGHVAATLLVIQALLAARVRGLDRAFGHDIVMQFHRSAGFLAAALALTHPILLTIDEGSLWLLSFDVGWRITLGRISLAVLVVAIAAITLGRFDYLRRRAVHGRAVGLATLVVLGHGWVMGSGTWIGALRVFWGILAGAFVLTVLYRKLYVPLWGRGRYAVASVESQTHDTWTIELTPESRPIGLHHPGQFMFLQVHAAGRREEHPFTIASAPRTDGSIAATIKESGDFTRGIASVAPGSLAAVEGPFGRFSYQFRAPSALLFIAGGVGITPIMSMLRRLRDTQDRRASVLLFGNRTEGDIIFRDELDALPGHVKVVHVLSDPSSGWSGSRGYITAGSIREHAAFVLASADVYLCGPPVMMEKTIRALRDLGVPWSRIHYERFAL